MHISHKVPKNKKRVKVFQKKKAILILNYMKSRYDCTVVPSEFKSPHFGTDDLKSL